MAPKTTALPPASATTADDTLKNLGEIFEDIEATGEDITPRLATIAENRWNKKLAPEKLALIQEKYKHPANCPTVCSMTVNPEIWSKLPHYQQRADLNISKIQESVGKAGLHDRSANGSFFDQYKVGRARSKTVAYTTS